jgi:predicted DCC family thiol-disulfide oxidoreductase YuxK
VKSHLRVASPPAKPLMIYDGDCSFCIRWIERWQKAVGGRVDFWPFQDPRMAAQFPEVPSTLCEQAVQFIETDGRVFDGAEAAFRALAYNPAQGRILRWYLRFPWFAAMAEWAYRLVARRRALFSRLTR